MAEEKEKSFLDTLKSAIKTSSATAKLGQLEIGLEKRSNKQVQVLK